MKLLALIALTVFSIRASAIQTDKIAHFSMSYACTLTGAHIIAKASDVQTAWGSVGAFGICQLIGLIKESTDPHFDNHDITANILGGLTAITISIPLNIGN